MIFRKDGTTSKKNTKTKIWWAKLAVAIVLSNVFFFVLFSEDEKKDDSELSTGWVEIHLKGELMTPFQSGKKVLLRQRTAGRSIEALLKTSEEGTFTVAVKEEEAALILAHESWEIVPFLKSLTLNPIARRGEGHEIRY